MLTWNRFQLKFLMALVLAIGLGSAVHAAGPIVLSPSSGQGYAQYNVGQEPIDNQWSQLTVGLTKDQTQLAFLFDFPVLDEFNYRANQNKITFDASCDANSQNIFFAQPVSQYANWDRILLKELHKLEKHKHGVEIDRKFTNTDLSGAPSRHLDSVWWDPREGLFTLITLITDGFDLYGVVTSFDSCELPSLEEMIADHDRIVDSIQVVR